MFFDKIFTIWKIGQISSQRVANTSEKKQYFSIEWMPKIRVFIFSGGGHINDILGGFRWLLTTESQLEVSHLSSCSYSLMIWTGHFYTEIFLA